MQMQMQTKRHGACLMMCKEPFLPAVLLATGLSWHCNPHHACSIKVCLLYVSSCHTVTCVFVVRIADP
jgi:hypothetical protein